MTDAKAASPRQRGGSPQASSHTLLEGRLGYQVESALLVRALTHRSYAYENGGLPTNERLEFLGDSVLGLVVTDTLYRTHPDLPEGQLAKLRAAVVNSRALAEVGRGLDLGAFIRLGRGEEGTGGRDKASILADTLEAVIGAVYLDQGLDAASELVHRLFDPLIEKSSNLGAGLDWKTSLQELTAIEGLGVPEYLVTETGPDHEKTFTAAARVGGVSYGTGTGRSKKEAEQQAAESAWRSIRAAADERAKAAKEAAEEPVRETADESAAEAVGEPVRETADEAVKAAEESVKGADASSATA
ncbi:ribonuclease III [Streptomyces achromogenes]|uniref:ribonuclease III n=1 Tax=Streptomyces achromogenes TaxID=67255 RepID=UPI0036A76443